MSIANRIQGTNRVNGFDRTNPFGRAMENSWQESIAMMHPSVPRVESFVDGNENREQVAPDDIQSAKS